MLVRRKAVRDSVTGALLTAVGGRCWLGANESGSGPGRPAPRQKPAKWPKLAPLHFAPA
ncbi:hypothetical protein F4827_005567 [Paraburkholderia bannensis]|uniref:Uncharacterized protein n=1 Tax=Paraburkholderia bannensis TaxID=765414 RepID=A0A7W9U2A5_9BURK|nr:hypothetical protein [Paraburkholderia sp. WP4_3_2]MBB6105697.1 hypothetical protein [Paraburkholderia bannensis]